jgi:hypothetical protein
LSYGIYANNITVKGALDIDIKVLDKNGGEIELSNLGEDDIEPMNIVSPAEDQLSDEEKTFDNEEEYFEEEESADYLDEIEFPEDFNEEELSDFDDFDE